MDEAEEPGEPDVTDAMMTRIGQAVMLLHGGDREEARGRLAALWAEIGDQGDPLHRCTLAHYMAGTQDDPEDELAWDLRALRAADALAPQGAGPGSASGPGSPSGAAPGIPGFYPALHLNLAAAYWKVGESRLALSHLGLARRACPSLADDAYGDGMRAAIGRMELWLMGSDQLP